MHAACFEFLFPGKGFSYDIKFTRRSSVCNFLSAAAVFVFYFLYLFSLSLSLKFIPRHKSFSFLGGGEGEENFITSF